MSEIEVYRGDSATLSLHIVDNDGDDYDLTNVDEIVFTIREHEDDDLILEKKMSEGQIVITDATSGECDIIIESGDTQDLAGCYVYDVEIRESGNIITVAKDKINIIKEVTH